MRLGIANKAVRNCECGMRLRMRCEIVNAVRNCECERCEIANAMWNCEFGADLQGVKLRMRFDAKIRMRYGIAYAVRNWDALRNCESGAKLRKWCDIANSARNCDHAVRNCECGAELRRNGMLHEVVNDLRCENANAVRNCKCVLKLRMR